MSVTSSLYITVSGVSSVCELLTVLQKCGWTWRNPANRIEFVPPHDGDAFDWVDESMTDAEFFAMLRKKEELHETAAAELYHAGDDVGVTLLTEDAAHFAFMLNCNRVKRTDSHRMGATDVNWYIAEIVWKLQEQGVTVQALQFEEIG